MVATSQPGPQYSATVRPRNVLHHPTPARPLADNTHFILEDHSKAMADAEHDRTHHLSPAFTVEMHDGWDAVTATRYLAAPTLDTSISTPTAITARDIAENIGREETAGSEPYQTAYDGFGLFAICAPIPRPMRNPVVTLERVDICQVHHTENAGGYTITFSTESAERHNMGYRYDRFTVTVPLAARPSTSDEYSQ